MCQIDRLVIADNLLQLDGMLLMPCRRNLGLIDEETTRAYVVLWVRAHFPHHEHGEGRFRLTSLSERGDLSHAKVALEMMMLGADFDLTRDWLPVTHAGFGDSLPETTEPPAPTSTTSRGRAAGEVDAGGDRVAVQVDGQTVGYYVYDETPHIF